MFDTFPNRRRGEGGARIGEKARRRQRGLKKEELYNIGNASGRYPFLVEVGGSFPEGASPFISTLPLLSFYAVPKINRHSVRRINEPADSPGSSALFPRNKGVHVISSASARRSEQNAACQASYHNLQGCA